MIETTYIWNFGDEFLVVCPKCKKCAKVIPRQVDKLPDIRLICGNCGLSKNWVRKSCGILTANNKTVFEEGEISIGDAVD